MNALTLIAGAFGLFRRDVVIAVGGYDRRMIGEDMDLTMRAAGDPIARRASRSGLPSIRSRSARHKCQRTGRRCGGSGCRWRRGLLQVLWRHRRMIGNPRFGILGMCVLPYVVVFDVLGPLIEITGYAVTTLAWFAGLLNWRHFRLLLLASLLFGVASTLVAVLLNDIATRRYMRGRDLVLLVAVAVLENCGYRQLNAWW